MYQPPTCIITPDSATIGGACAAAVEFLEIVQHLGPDAMWPNATKEQRNRFACGIDDYIKICSTPGPEAVINAADALAVLWDGIHEGRLLTCAPDHVKAAFRQALAIAGDIVVPVAEAISLH